MEPRPAVGAYSTLADPLAGFNDKEMGKTGGGMRGNGIGEETGEEERQGGRQVGEREKGTGREISPLRSFLKVCAYGLWPPLSILGLFGT